VDVVAGAAAFEEVAVATDCLAAAFRGSPSHLPNTPAEPSELIAVPAIRRAAGTSAEAADASLSFRW
jgi:hypothetical protein